MVVLVDHLGRIRGNMQKLSVHRGTFPTARLHGSTYAKEQKITMAHADMHKISMHLGGKKKHTAPRILGSRKNVLRALESNHQPGRDLEWLG
jgi:hypothetical protein